MAHVMYLQTYRPIRPKLTGPIYLFGAELSQIHAKCDLLNHDFNNEHLIKLKSLIG